MRATTLKEVKKGEFFTLKPVEEPNESLVWVKDSYDKATKKFDVYKFSDANHFSQKNGNTTVYVDFTF